MTTTPTSVPSLANRLSRGEARWVLRRCSWRGHVLAHLDDGSLRALTGPVPSSPEGTILLRCLRCGAWVDPGDVNVGEVVGSPDTPVAVGDLPLPVRGAHGRRIGLLRLVALERTAKGLLMIAGAVVVYQVASSRGSILAQIERLLIAFRPLGQELGVHLTGSPLVVRVEEWLGGSGDTVRLAGLGLLVYGVVQIIECRPLGRVEIWAEYPAAVATSAFIPLEVYELQHKPTPLKAAALAINIVVVVYLVFQGRLFGVRGGHAAFRVV